MTADVVLDEGANFGASFRGGQFFRLQMSELIIGAQFRFHLFSALVQARIVMLSFVVISEGATEGSQQNDSDFHFRI